MAIIKVKTRGTDNVTGRRNIVHNGAMQVDQRHNGSSFTVVNGNSITGYIADRFRINENSSSAMTAQTVSDAPAGFAHSIKLTVTTADASLAGTEFHRIIQGIEGKDIAHLNFGSANAKTLTLSFHVKSSVTGQYYFSIFNGAANRTQLKGYTISSANTWEKKTITITPDTAGTWVNTNAVGMYIMWSLGTGTSYQSNTIDAWIGSFAMAKSDQVNLAATNGSTFQLTGVQLEIGDTASDFEHRSHSEELSLCQRYFYKFINTGLSDQFNFYSPYSPAQITAGLPNSSAICPMTFPTTMRAAPTVATTISGGTLNRQTSTPFGYVAQIGTTSTGTHYITQYLADAEL